MIKFKKQWIILVLKCIKDNFKLLNTAFILTISSALCSLYHREYTRLAINEMSKGIDKFAFVLLFGLLVLILRIISYMGLYMANFIKLKYRNKIRFALGKEILFHLISLPMNNLENEKVGDNITRLTSDIEGVSDLIDNIINSIGLFSFTFVGAAYLTFKLDWKIAVISFLIIDPLTLLITKYYTQKIQKYEKKEREEIAVVTNNVSEIIQGITTTKSYTLENFFKNRYETIATKLSDIRQKLFVTNTIAENEQLKKHQYISTVETEYF